MKKPKERDIILSATTVAQNSFELRDVPLSTHQINMAYLKMVHSPQSWWDTIPEYTPLSKVAKELILEAKKHDEGDDVLV